MPQLPPQHNFLRATFTANPDVFMDYIFNSEPINIKAFADFNKNIQKIARNEVTMRLLPKLNDEVITAWEKFVNEEWKSISRGDEISSPFEHLKRVVDDIMIINEGIPYFKINDIGIWNNLTFKMGEDLFSAVKLADNFIKHGVQPKHFQWNYILHSNFFDLNKLLKKEKINENHYHLFGSSPNVDLSWLFLMNNPDNQANRFENFEKDFALEQGHLNTNAAFKQTGLYHLVKIAAYIRVRLFEKCCPSESETKTNASNEWCIGKILNDIKHLRTHGFIINDTYDMQSKINIHKYRSHYRYKEENRAVDYAIRGFEQKENLNYIEIAGERYLYYRCLKDIFDCDKQEHSKELQMLFYLYLLIKNKFGDAFIQRNKKYGFDNFQQYTKTKSEIINGTFYEKLAVKMAVKYNIDENHIEKLEARIKPTDKEEKLRKTIEYCDNYSEEKKKFTFNNGKCDNHSKENSPQNHFYVIHFIKNKESDWGIGKDSDMTCVCRESKLREKIKNEALAINELRKNASESAFRIYGIDAASHEVNCRPEVFGQVFRYLSNSNIKYSPLHYDQSKIYLPHLKKTYHAGEDFYDIIDGLRSIDEAILFLMLKCGDRIGHAVALGIDAEKYYHDRPYIAMPLQNALDNYAWILYCIKKLGMNVSQSFYAHLKFQFDTYFNDLYHHSSSSHSSISPDLQAYIQSWKLRGDNPDCYSKEIMNIDNIGNITKPHLNPVTEWDRYNFCYRDDYKNVKKNVYDLYHKYHFDNKLKKEAEKIVEIKVNDEYVELVKQLQIIMRNFVLCKGVAIESNPSSNFLISKLDKTIELPVFKLFPIEESENDFVRLNVSVNTDDQGVFYTSLIKEYTLLVGALQNERNEQNKVLRKYSNDKILTWIKHLIDNSKTQCFMQN